MSASAARSALVRAVKIAAVVAFALTTLLALGELGVRALYQYAFWSTERLPLVYERVYWAVPPWVARTSVMYDDAELGLWMKPNANRTYVNLFGPIGSLGDVGLLFDSLFPTLPDWAQQRPVWHLSTNASGLRGDDLPTQKSPDTFRIVVLGDLWTVGINVELALTYPAQLQEILAQELSAGRVEVLNLGVIGGSADTGVRLLSRVRALSPDLGIVAYAQNDEAEARDTGYKPPRPPGQLPRPPFRWSALLRQSELYKLYQWWSTPRADRIEGTLRGELTRTSMTPSNSPGRRCPNPWYTKTRYHAALERIVHDLGEAGIPVLLLYNNVPNFTSHCTMKAMQAIARSAGLPMVDSSTILEERAQAIATEREQRLGLIPRDAASETRTHGGIDVVFRVGMSADPSRAAPYVMGNTSQLGSLRPNTVALHDDATHGDQIAGDRVWSRKVRFAGPTVLTYLFTNGSEAGSWTGLESYRLRAYALRRPDTGRTVYLPVEQFGVHALRSDSSHPDARGYRAIAEALATTVRGTAAFDRLRNTDRDG